MEFLLHIPAYYSEAKKGNVDDDMVFVHLDSLPRKGEQIGTPGGGLAEVCMVRYHPVWDGDKQRNYLLPGGQSKGARLHTSVFTNWVRVPEDG